MLSKSDKPPEVTEDKNKSQSNGHVQKIDIVEVAENLDKVMSEKDTNDENATSDGEVKFCII